MNWSKFSPLSNEGSNLNDLCWHSRIFFSGMAESTDIFRLRNILHQCRLSQLVSACRYYSIKRSGSKPEVLERLLGFLISASTVERNYLSAALTGADRLSAQPNAPSPHIETSFMRSPKKDQNIKFLDSKELTSRFLEHRNQDTDMVMKVLEEIDPFHPLAPVACPYLYIGACQSGSMSFSLDVPELKNLRRQGYSLWMRCTSKEFTKHDRHVWPRELRVFVNLSQVFKVDEPKKLKKRRDEPVDLTAFFQSGMNQVQISVSDSSPNRFTIALIVCGTLGNQAIVDSVPFRSTEDCKDIFRKIIHGMKSDLLVEQYEDRLLSLDLRCPISLEKVEIPTRGISCEHLRFFDLNSFVSVNRQTSNINLRWMCPVCQRLLLAKDLVRDGYAKEIVDSTSSNVTSVLINTETVEWKLDGKVIPEVSNEESSPENHCLRLEGALEAHQPTLKEEVPIEIPEDSPRDEYEAKRLKTNAPGTPEIFVIELD